jgi:cytochrome c
LRFLFEIFYSFMRISTWRQSMKYALILAGLWVVLPSVSMADDKLAQSKACMACHAVDKKMVGPAYQDVAKKYAADKDAVTKLAASIKAGGSGKWGPVPMPAQASLSDAEAKTLAAWVMGMAKK